METSTTGPIRVAGAVIEADRPMDCAGWCLEGATWANGRVLIARRRIDKREGGKWELPGGKLEPGESAQVCLVRELAEELGIAVLVGAHVATNVHDYGRGPIALEAWRARWVSGALTLIDHDAVAWVDVEALRDFELAAADVPLIDALIAP